MSFYWNFKLSYNLLRIAKDQLYKNNYIVANICIKIFTELIDTSILNSEISQNQEYETIKWSKRINWMKSNDINLLNDWNNLNSLCIKICKNNEDNDVAKSMIEITESQIKNKHQKYTKFFHIN
ncbi:MAG: hypothetical protein DA328_06205 [Nitrososphaeraceae archaeon]|nr:hypothetical protein [Nitrososphaeraceae archaeon]